MFPTCTQTLGSAYMLICTSRSSGFGDTPSIGSSTQPLIFRNAPAPSEMVSKGVAAFPYALKGVSARLTPLCYYVVKCDTARSLGQ